MKRIFLILFLVLLSQRLVNAQDLFIRNDKYSTEAFIKIDPNLISSVKKGDNAVMIYFKKNLKNPFKRELDDPYISSITAKANILTLNIKKGSEFSILNDLSGIKIMATKSKTVTDILSSYGIGKPLLTSTSTVVEDKTQEVAIDKAEKLITEKRFKEATVLLNDVLKTSKNDFYRQEAFYRLGQTYLLLAESNTEYFNNAYQTFDDFAKLYPDNFRVSDAMFKSAEAKEKIGQLFEAIFTYKKIYDSVTDLESKRIALLKIADLYNRVGQTDNAIEQYKLYTQTFKANAEQAFASLAQIYFDLREYDMAFEAYMNLPIDKFIADPNITPKNLLSLAKTLEIKNQFDDSLKVYKAIYEKYPESDLTNEAIAKSADILKNLNRTEDSDKMMLHLKQIFPKMQTGQNAALQYARKYLATKPYAFWQEFFKDMLSEPDTFALHNEANYLLIKSISPDNKTELTIKVNEFIKKYPLSPHINEIDNMREDLIFEEIQKIYKDKNYDILTERLQIFQSEYPKTKYTKEIAVMHDDLLFREALTMYASNQFKDTINAVEEHVLSEPADTTNAKWFDLLEDAYYKQLQQFVDRDNQPAVKVAARQYLTLFPQGKSIQNAIEHLKISFDKPFKKLYHDASYPALVKFYDESIAWLQPYIDKVEQDKYKLMVALSVYKLDSKDKAKQLYNELPKMTDTDYTILGILLNDKSQYEKIDTLDVENFTYIIKELENHDVDTAINLLKLYKSDMKTATKLEYDIAKNIPSDIKRETIILDIYDTVRTDKNARFDGSDDITLDVGVLYFKKNDFKGAVQPLKEYIDVTEENNDKKAEAYYYLGKSFINMNDKDRGFQYYNELIETIPDSIFAGIAKNEIDNFNWKKSINSIK